MTTSPVPTVRSPSDTRHHESHIFWGEIYFRAAERPGEWEERAAELVNSFAHDLKRYPAASCHLLGAVEFAAGPSFEVVIAGISGKEDTVELLTALNRSFQPNLVKIFVPLEEENPEIARYTPHAAAFRAEGGRATAFVCSNFQCSSPTTDRDEMLSRLSAGEPGPVG